MGGSLALVYDAECTLCRTLAHKVHHASRERIDIMAINDPETEATLSRFYPRGWAHDFHLISDKRARRGLAVLPRLTRELGPGTMAMLVGEYLRAKHQQTKGCASCAARSAESKAASNGHDEHAHAHPGSSRRDVLKLAAMTPLALTVGKLPALPSAYTSAPKGLAVHLAKVSGTTASVSVPSVSILPRKDVIPTEQKGVKADITDRGTIHKVDLPATFSSGRQAQLEWKELVYKADGRTMTVYRGSIIHPRYNIGLTIGHGHALGAGGELVKASSVAGMIQHHAPDLMVDYVVNGSSSLSDQQVLKSYATGLSELSRFHRSASRTRRASAYDEIGQGMNLLAASFAERVPHYASSSRNLLAIAPSKDLLSFAVLPDTTEAAIETAALVDGCWWDCSCDCNYNCCFCGCGCDFCEGCDCGCCCGPQCGCGCEYCCAMSAIGNIAKIGIQK
jgi:predicted DCC family thiol-disulfide oxidoreductase YuxK